MKTTNRNSRWTLITATIFLMLSVGCAGNGNGEDLAILSLLGIDRQTIESQASGINVTLTIPDNDRDMIADATENYLMRKFAPRYYLHPRETAMPASVAWILPHTQMRHNSDNLCRDDVVLDWGQVTSRNMSQQYARGKSKWPFCRRNGGHYYSHTDYPDNDTFYLSIASAKHAGNINAAKCYARVGISTKSYAKYEIEYWFFYAWNPSVIAGEHEGDWENVRVYLTDRDTVHSVDYAAHGTPKKYNAGHPDLNLLGGLRPDVYSARGTHASHPKPGRFTTVNLGHVRIYEETARGGRVLDCAAAGRLINVGNYAYPSRGNEWVKYKGDWGFKKDLARSLTQIAGPGGPKLLGINWNTQALVSGPGSFRFPKTTNGNINKGYTFDARLGKKVGTPRISRVTTSDGYNARATVSGNNINVSFRQRRDVRRQSYTITVHYSLPKIGGLGTRVNLTRSKQVTVYYDAYNDGGQGCDGRDGPRSIRDCLPY